MQTVEYVYCCFIKSSCKKYFRGWFSVFGGGGSCIPEPILKTFVPLWNDTNSLLFISNSVISPLFSLLCFFTLSEALNCFPLSHPVALVKRAGSPGQHKSSIFLLHQCNPFPTALCFWCLYGHPDKWLPHWILSRYMQLYPLLLLLGWLPWAETSESVSSKHFK